MATDHVVPEASFCEEALSANLAEIRPISVTVRHVLNVLCLRGEFPLTLGTLGHREGTGAPLLVHA